MKKMLCDDDYYNNACINYRETRKEPDKIK